MRLHSRTLFRHIKPNITEGCVHITIYIYTCIRISIHLILGSANRVRVSTKLALDFLQDLLDQGLAGKVDLIFTDPPWGTNYEGRSKNVMKSDVIYVGDIAKVAELIAKLLCDKGTVPTHPHTHAHTPTHTRTRTHARAHTHTDTYTHTHTQTHTPNV
jgi:hypothetical protein